MISAGFALEKQKQYERAFMEDDLDAFDFILAEKLRMTVEQMRGVMANAEYVQWRAFYAYRNAMAKLELDKAKRE